jgi:hypothetical protein
LYTEAGAASSGGDAFTSPGAEIRDATNPDNIVDPLIPGGSVPDPVGEITIVDFAWLAALATGWESDPTP